MEMEATKPRGTPPLPHRLLKTIVYRVIAAYPEPVSTGVISECTQDTLERLGYLPTRNDQIRQQLIWLRLDGLIASEPMPGTTELSWHSLGRSDDEVTEALHRRYGKPRRIPTGKLRNIWITERAPGPPIPALIPTEDEIPGAEETLTMFGPAPLWHVEHPLPMGHEIVS